MHPYKRQHTLPPHRPTDFSHAEQPDYYDAVRRRRLLSFQRLSNTQFFRALSDVCSLFFFLVSLSLSPPSVFFQTTTRSHSPSVRSLSLSSTHTTEQLSLLLVGRAASIAYSTRPALEMCYTKRTLASVRAPPVYTHSSAERRARVVVRVARVHTTQAPTHKIIMLKSLRTKNFF